MGVTMSATRTPRLQDVADTRKPCPELEDRSDKVEILRSAIAAIGRISQGADDIAKLGAVNAIGNAMAAADPRDAAEAAELAIATIESLADGTGSETKSHAAWSVAQSLAAVYRSEV